MTHLHPFYRDTWAEINLNAISENVKNIKDNLPQDVEVMAVVKANAYGHGAEEVAREALSAGATYLGVAILDEAIALRKAGVDAPLLVLGLIRPEDVQKAAELDITITIFQKEWLDRAAGYLSEGDEVTCHIKFDSGMGRIGLRTREEKEELIKSFQAAPNFKVEGLYTHLATADEIDLSYYEKQQQRFSHMIKEFEELYGEEVKLKHCGNSAAALRFGTQCYNLVRVGIAMYGLSPSEAIKDLVNVPLKEAFSLHSRITHIKKLPKGEGLSYGVTYETEGEEWIATVPIGYADGWIRANQSGDVLVNGKRAKIVGRICMDQMMIRLTEPVKEGTQVTLIGRNGGAFLSVDEVARRLQTINYEIPCIISYRVPRAIEKNNEILKVHNNIF
ncbi:alanine racemase [Salipaludibacillus sp. CUR1]|uniref:alanine racemase n=1 Tax=Salipaludibacillus sp. CUR1 TaxID=2820003 RepID=UPI001E30FC9A|nr:alanine racemase [Salipaludibacillus sp. CUR1]